VGLLEEVQAAQEARRVVLCSVCKAIRAMDEREADELEAVLDRDDVDARSLADVLRVRGYDVKQQAVQRHRRGACGGAR
jgi:hypothetical protein